MGVHVSGMQKMPSQTQDKNRAEVQILSVLQQKHKIEMMKDETDNKRKGIC